LGVSLAVSPIRKIEYMFDINTNNDSPNLSIVLPGGCNADCWFCIYNQNTKQETHPEYITHLEYVLDNMPEQFHQISITGGEPTISGYFITLLDILEKRRDKYTKIVLNTNGTQFSSNNLPKMYNVVDHINLSRHGINEADNQHIFNTGGIPTAKQILRHNTYLNSLGIDVTLNTVEFTRRDTDKFVRDYIKFAKSVNANAVCFRKECVDGNDLSPTVNELYFKNYKTVNETRCPVCRTTTKIINGMYVTWKAGILETSVSKWNNMVDVNTQDLIYECVFHPNGKLTSDWACNSAPINNLGNFIQELETKTVRDKDKKELEDKITALNQKMDKVLAMFSPKQRDKMWHSSYAELRKEHRKKEVPEKATPVDSCGRGYCGCH